MENAAVTVWTGYGDPIKATLRISDILDRLEHRFRLTGFFREQPDLETQLRVEAHVARRVKPIGDGVTACAIPLQIDDTSHPIGQLIERIKIGDFKLESLSQEEHRVFTEYFGGSITTVTPSPNNHYMTDPYLVWDKAGQRQHQYNDIGFGNRVIGYEIFLYVHMNCAQFLGAVRQAIETNTLVDCTTDTAGIKPIPNFALAAMKVYRGGLLEVIPFDKIDSVNSPYNAMRYMITQSRTNSDGGTTFFLRENIKNGRLKVTPISIDMGRDQFLDLCKEAIMGGGEVDFTRKVGRTGAILMNVDPSPEAGVLFAILSELVKHPHFPEILSGMVQGSFEGQEVVFQLHKVTGNALKL